MPHDFVFLQEIDATIIESARYAMHENFTGRPVTGYSTGNIVATRQAASRLKQVNAKLTQQGYTLVVYDGYRPQRSVEAFIRWSRDVEDQLAKRYYYPTINKKDIFDLGYIAERSGHSRGSTVDITIIQSSMSLKTVTKSNRELRNGEMIPFLDDNTVNMGSSFDLFHEVSHHDSPLVDEQHSTPRNFLCNTMKEHGFKEYAKEWWHYTLIDEPYPNTYFDFDPFD